MNARVDVLKTAPAAYKAMAALSQTVENSGLEHSLLELVKMRASQINGCAYCLAMHSRDARKGGETEMRLYLINAWEESSLYTPRERAALGWTDALTRVADTHAPDAAWDEVQQHFTDKEAVDLTTLIGMINLWNRLAIGFRYQHPADEAK